MVGCRLAAGVRRRLSVVASPGASDGITVGVARPSHGADGSRTLSGPLVAPPILVIVTGTMRWLPTSIEASTNATLACRRGCSALVVQFTGRSYDTPSEEVMRSEKLPVPADPAAAVAVKFTFTVASDPSPVA